MLIKLKNYSHLTAMKNLMIGFLILYSITLTVILLKLDLNPMVIGIDPFGTRVVTTAEDPILKAEKISFMKQFLNHLYNYDETSFDDRISHVGDLMAQSLWESKLEDFKSISDRLKSEPLRQMGSIVDLREFSDSRYEADLEVKIVSRLKESKLKVRVGIDLNQSARTMTKPYPWEVKTYDENVIN
jgi:hypothetical protein